MNVARHAASAALDVDVRYLANLSKGIRTVDRKLLALDPQRAFNVCRDHPDEQDSLLAFLKRVESWSTTVRSGLRPPLRDVE